VSTLVISPTSIISTFCYSVLRLEPYHLCEFSCTYCYARWYRFQDPKLTNRHIREFLHYVKYVSKTRPARLIPFRLSTLVDPLQRNDKCLANCRLFLEVCLRELIPVILNTKSDLILRDDILEIVLKLAEHRLVVIQVSIPFLNERAWTYLEPNAPSPIRRLEVVEILSRQHDIPVVVRVQPVVPGITDLELRELMRSIAEAGARHVILESLRLDSQTLRLVSSKLPEVLEVKWVPYTEVTSSLLWPERTWRRKVSEHARSLCDTYGLLFATCKEEFLDLWTAPDCCGIYLLAERAGLRVTLRELANLPHVPNSIEDLVLLGEKLGDRYLTKGDIDALPREVRKKLLHHYKILLGVVKSGKCKDVLYYIKQSNT